MRKKNENKASGGGTSRGNLKITTNGSKGGGIVPGHVSSAFGAGSYNPLEGKKKKTIHVGGGEWKHL